MTDTDRKPRAHSMGKGIQPARSVKGELITTGGSPALLDNLPPILSGRATPAVAKKVRQFYLSVAEIFERWVAATISSSFFSVAPSSSLRLRVRSSANRGLRHTISRSPG